MCRSTNHRHSLAEPEVWFRIVHITMDSQNAAYRKQTIEIALGPRGAFENGNIGALTRKVPTDRVVSAVPPCRGKPKPLKDPRTPRVLESLRKAIEWQALLESGEAANQAEIARREGITRARVTQVMGMLRLAPEIQQHILSMPDMVRRPAITERALRPIAKTERHEDQLKAFFALFDGGEGYAHSYLMKSFDHDDLLSTVQAALKGEGFPTYGNLCTARDRVRGERLSPDTLMTPGCRGGSFEVGHEDPVV